MIEYFAIGALGLTCVAFAALYLRNRSYWEKEGASVLSFKTLAEVAPAGIWRTDRKGQCVYVNKAWEESAGLTEWHGDDWTNALHPEDKERVVKTLMSAVAREEKIEEEWRWQHSDGQTVWVKGLGAPEYDDDGDLVGYVGINIDIQRSKTLEEELNAARQRAEDEARAKSTFLANMSHEIRTPMNGVVGFTELLLESDLDEPQRAQVQLIADSGRAMMQLLNDVLDHSKIESGQLRITLQPTDIRSQLKHCIKLMEPMARSKGLSLGVWVDDVVPKLVETDQLRLRQVLLNLIGNAVKFTKSGGIDVEARTENSSDGCSLLISVIDTGIGIDESKLDSIFAPFHQEDGSIARRYGGTGLGLAISSQLISMMDGRISVQSKPGVGTQFTIRLPMRKVDILPTPEPISVAGRSDTTLACLKGTRVLVAEDHSINQELIMAMADALELDALLVQNGEEAVNAVLEAAEAGKPFVAVLMDMQMPEVDGLEATRHLRALGFHADTLPIIALTANCYPDDVTACKEAGMQSHLGKPVTTVALARELARWLTPGAAQPAPCPSMGKDDDKTPGCPAFSKCAESLEDRYRNRKSQLAIALRRSLDQTPGQTDWSELATQLHKLAGVAATFGEPELGEASRRLERKLNSAHSPHELRRALKRELPLFEKAA